MRFSFLSADVCLRSVLTLGIIAQICFSPSASAQAVDYQLSVIGPSTVYAGNTVYYAIKPTFTFFTPQTTVSSLLNRWWVNTVQLSGTPVDFRVNCRITDCGTDWNGRFESNGEVVLRAFIPATTSVKQYTLGITVEVGGVIKTTNVPLRVLPTPAPLPVLTSIPSIPIPGVQKWEDNMVKLGTKWCGSTDTFSFSAESQVWYYDGARVYFQMADYTRNRSWEACALNLARQYRDHVIRNSGKLLGSRVFSRGLLMAWQRTGDASFREAVTLLSKNATAWTLAVSDEAIRETAYIVDAHIDAERAGEPRHPALLRNIDYLLGYYDMLFVSKSYRIHQSFYDGLAAEALINYYELTKDPRIPPTIKLMLDWTWDYGWDKSRYLMVYNPEPFGAKCTWGCQEYGSSLVSLVVPAFAWYWSLTGDPAYQRRGDEIFSHALDEDLSFSGKVFSQTYHWSFDYLRWRGSAQNAPTCTYSVSPSSASLPASQGTATFQVSTTAGCPWIASSTASWAVPSADANRNGSGSVTYSIGANTLSTTRSATLNIAGKTIVLTQAATAALPQSPTTPQSLALMPGATGTYTIPDTAPFNAVGDFRFEMRIHGYNVTTSANEYSNIWAAENLAILRGGAKGQTIRFHYSPSIIVLNVAGMDDFILRVQRFSATGKLHVEVWPAEGASAPKVVGAAEAPTRLLNFAGTRTIGSSRTSNANIAWVRWYSTTVPLKGAPPADTGIGDLATWLFDGDGMDSVNGLNINTKASYIPTP